jgi:hypothetical protein
MDDHCPLHSHEVLEEDDEEPPYQVKPTFSIPQQDPQYDEEEEEEEDEDSDPEGMIMKGIDSEIETPTSDYSLDDTAADV